MSQICEWVGTEDRLSSLRGCLLAGSLPAQPQRCVCTEIFALSLSLEVESLMSRAGTTLLGAGTQVCCVEAQTVRSLQQLCHPQQGCSEDGEAICM